MSDLSDFALLRAITSVADDIGPKSRARMLEAFRSAINEPLPAKHQSNDDATRMHFASAALNGLLASGGPLLDMDYQLQHGLTIIENYAACAYQIADAMLKAASPP